MNIAKKATLQQHKAERIDQLEKTEAPQQIYGQNVVAHTGAAEYERRNTAEIEAALRAALTQTQQELHFQELLIQEANHRTNNAFQLIIGRLSVQANRAEDVTMRDALETVIDHIGRIHEVQTLLAYNTSPGVVDLSIYLQRLILGIAGSFAAERVAISADLEVLDVAWERKTVVPLGLIVVEALTNSLKYAFPDGRNGQIRVSMRAQDNVIRLEIEDDGHGMPVEGRSGSRGLGLIERLAEEVEGAATVSSRSNGTLVRVIFPNPYSDDRV